MPQTSKRQDAGPNKQVLGVTEGRKAVESLIAAVRHECLVVHGRVFCLQSPPHAAPTTIAPHQEVVLEVPCCRALKAGMPFLQVQVSQGAAIVQ